MKYESSIFNSIKVMAKVKVFVHTSNADTDANARAMTIAPHLNSLDWEKMLFYQALVPQVCGASIKNHGFVFIFLGFLSKTKVVRHENTI